VTNPTGMPPVFTRILDAITPQEEPMPTTDLPTTNEPADPSSYMPNYAGPKAGHERRTRHVLTNAEGRVTGWTEKLYPTDEQGPWSFVVFDDGLECWVPDEQLVAMHKVELDPPFGPRLHLDTHDFRVELLMDRAVRISIEDTDAGVGVWVYTGDDDTERRLLGEITWAGEPRGDMAVLDQMAALSPPATPRTTASGPAPAGSRTSASWSSAPAAT
jgi:hypothetical protein